MGKKSMDFRIVMVKVLNNYDNLCKAAPMHDSGMVADTQMA